MSDWHTHVFTSTYTADVSGACSMMYELGGMTVLHDPSGCNSTYTTHDEPRWYDTDSLMFISALDEMSAIMGDDTVLIEDVTKAAADLHPRFITLCGASIPHIIAFDFKGVARLLERKTGIPVLPVETDGLQSYIGGASKAAIAFLNRFADRNVMKKERSINLLGVTPIDFSSDENVDALKKVFTDAGYDVNCIMGMHSSFEEWQNAWAANVNVAVSAIGRNIAEKMKMPYVEGTPIGSHMTEKLLEALAATMKDGKNRIAYDLGEEGKLLVVGEEVISKSLACGLAQSLDTCVSVLYPDPVEGLDEEVLMEKIAASEAVICDPLFANVFAGTKAKLIPFPHEGYSGRIYRKDIPVFCGSSFTLGGLLK
ncbi:MAG: hypothetical protein IKD69_01690 [Solobacterium sp.]|nr:hypothetical protein [Solobacterium sp.]